MGHAIARAISDVINAAQPGGELETMAALDEAMAPYLQPIPRQNRIEAVMAKEIAGRAADNVFDEDTCGEAPAIVCQKAYAERMRRAVREQNQQDGYWRAACPPPVRPADAQQLGLPTWHPMLDEWMQEGWMELCRP